MLLWLAVCQDVTRKILSENYIPIVHQQLVPLEIMFE
jgi:hypothetical protein